MTVDARPSIALDDLYARELPELCEAWSAAPSPAPALLALNEDLALELGLDPAWLREPGGIALLTGRELPEGAVPVAQAYAGHQFGSWSPRLGDGRALLLGELVGPDGRRRDLHLKGSGRTTFARGGDGRAAVGPMLREYVVAEAMHALGIPTTRALAVVATGDRVVRETMLPGAVLARIAASHIRVGTFQYAAAQGGPALVRRLADHAIARHHPAAADEDVPYLALLEAVVDAQARLVAQWMLVGFVHGVMNTDNMTISGETIDYGPCAFMDAYDPATVFSSIDHGGRYAYGNQPPVAQWNLARLAEALLPLLHDDADTAITAATEVLGTFPDRFRDAWIAGMGAKLGLAGAGEDDAPLLDGLLEALAQGGVDFTLAFRGLAGSLRGDGGALPAVPGDVTALEAWTARWHARLSAEGRDPAEAAAAMDRVNPRYVPRNHVVEDALASATAGDPGPVARLVEVLARPFDEQEGAEDVGQPAPAGDGPYRTFCGT